MMGFLSQKGNLQRELTHLHHIDIPELDWEEVLCSHPPAAPEAVTLHCEPILAKIHRYTPSKLSQWLRLDVLLRIALWKAYKRAELKDLRLTEQQYQIWLDTHQTWLSLTDLASALSRKQPGARLRALKTQALYQHLHQLGIRLAVDDNPSIPQVSVFAHCERLLTDSWVPHPLDDQSQQYQAYIHSLTLSVTTLLRHTLGFDETLLLSIYEGTNTASPCLVQRRIQRKASTQEGDWVLSSSLPIGP